MRSSEFKRQQRLVGFYLSAHTGLAERMRRRRRALVTAIIILSVVATALAFADGDRHIDFIFRASLPTWAGVLSSLVFVLALLDLLFGWERIAAEHEDAARRLDPLAALYRGIKPEGEEIDTGDIDLDSEYWNVLDSIARIPNRYFAQLKAQHLHKIAVSQALDAFPSASPRAIKLKLRWSETFRFLRGGSSEPRPGSMAHEESVPSEASPPSSPSR